ncbi:MAG: class I SAM-dependent methyltransferase [Gemmatimonadales bacterium]
MAEWFQSWFGTEYLDLYPHRDERDAERLIVLLRRTLPWQDAWRVLDVACGPGRHMRALEQAGARVFGFDLSRALLNRAQSVTGRPLVRADMRCLPFRAGSMDLTVNLFTSFGYFATDAAHAAALGGMLGTVRPGGWFVLDFLHAGAVRSTLVADEMQQLGGADIQVRREIIDQGRVVRKTMLLPDGRQFEERVRLFTEGELVAMIESHGARVTSRFGDYDGAPLGDGPRVILLAQVLT